MTDEQYLKAVLAGQDLEEDGPEMKDLAERRRDVERILRRRFGKEPVMKVGGSVAKGTTNRESYDLDLPFYFPRDDESGGKTIREIYENVEEALQEHYHTERKGVAVRLYEREKGTDFHTDVVPGRYIDGDSGDAFLYPANTEKERLQTNLEVHIAHVKDSGVVDAIRLQKLWRVRRNLSVKTFALELLTIDLLATRKHDKLPDQMIHVWTEFRDNIDDLCIEDPANSGNDLSEMLNDAVRDQLQANARQTLEILERQGWAGVFGVLTSAGSKAARVEGLRRVAATAPGVARPWARGER